MRKIGRNRLALGNGPRSAITADYGGVLPEQKKVGRFRRERNRGMGCTERTENQTEDRSTGITAQSVPEQRVEMLILE